MLFSTSIILPIALLCHTAASLSVPELSGVSSLARRSQKDPGQYTKPAVDKINQKAKQIAKHVHEDKAQVLIETDLQVVVEAFEDFINGMKGCNCTGKGEVDLNGYKDLVVEVFASVQVVIEIIVGTQDKTLIKSAQDVFSQFTVHVAKLVDLVIKVDIKVAVAVRDNVDASAYATIGVDIVELVNGKVAGEVSGQAGVEGKPDVKHYPKDNSTGPIPPKNSTGPIPPKNSTGHH
ncbi:uncharacterized protein MELLADRAFT_124340 [Melampsora larici-populina 98AG31]|uniref:Secreted protein n=1 Tax=Melampsora larici-populina (strain 98AG31 / pathotype 3-4-7) TaxID=747676 RepID=F4RAJ0_MELLP|nr:uncharacterized protein MELLADRAFT_124340 [Melampsora larici-populina 98AG31]EGG10487.1 secreted protein [Melampsora larici-populina 98AG31]